MACRSDGVRPVVWCTTRNPSRLKICLVSKKKGRIWALPKGRLDPGDRRANGLSGNSEETGHESNVGAMIDEIHYYFFLDENQTYYHKTVTFYVMRVTKEHAQQRDQEADEVACVRFSGSLAQAFLFERKEDSEESPADGISLQFGKNRAGPVQTAEAGQSIWSRSTRKKTAHWLTRALPVTSSEHQRWYESLVSRRMRSSSRSSRTEARPLWAMSGCGGCTRSTVAPNYAF